MKLLLGLRSVWKRLQGFEPQLCCQGTELAVLSLYHVVADHWERIADSDYL